MQDKKDVARLIEEAKKAAGSYRAISQMTGILPPNLSSIKAGNREASPEELALLAEVAGMNAAEWLVRGVIAKHEGTEKGTRLLRALGKSLPAITALVAASNGHAAIAGELVQQAANWHAHLMILLYTMYSNVKRKLHTLL